ncbi:hypothetical protein V6N13_107637 [Hibiscus sabdariffa]
MLNLISARHAYLLLEKKSKASSYMPCELGVLCGSEIIWTYVIQVQWGPEKESDPLKDFDKSYGHEELHIGQLGPPIPRCDGLLLVGFDSHL